MLSRQGRVLWVRSGRAGLCLRSLPGCAGCATTCALFSFGRAFRRARRELEVAVPQELELRPGQLVQIEMLPAGFARAAVTGFGLPLLALIAGSVAGSVGGSHLPAGLADGAVLAGAIGGLGLGTWLAARAARHERRLELRLRAMSSS
ncbi:MAG: SoxR reducing system RseC family protein [Gammaproteobacteria bacterium]|nr:SoxR reducing system RseC family protein [Gammaproteobacteria bacterium]